MNVFISWSGKSSEAVAQALTNWLPDVIQAVKPFMSREDIRKRALWGQVIAQQLRDSKFGILCLTRDNLDATWLHFEAGAIAKAVDDSLVWTYLFHVQPSEVKSPLADFQYTSVEREDTKRLVRTINTALGDEKLPDEQLSRIFDRCWSDLEKELEKIPATTESPQPKRSVEDMTTEILEIVRGLSRSRAVAIGDVDDSTEVRRQALRMLSGLYDKTPNDRLGALFVEGSLSKLGAQFIEGSLRRKTALEDNERKETEKNE
jgi:hypothetical protein